MTVRELLEKLKEVDQNLKVYCTSATGAYEYGLVQSTAVQSISIVDSEGFSEKDEEVVFIIDEQ